MSLSPFYSFQSRFVTYLLNRPRIYACPYYKLCVEHHQEDLIVQQDRQCTYNVTMKHDRATIVAVDKQKMLQILNVSF